MSTFEVEIKFRVQNPLELERRLQQQFGVGFSEPVTESDIFFQHPCRDFVQTDEVLRLRNRNLADGTSECILTYKGPNIDTRTKTRQEIEQPITEPEQWEVVLDALGFRKFAFVQKFRRRVKLTVNHRHIEIVLDTLPILPESSRTFLEVEILTTAENLDECRSLILDIANQLELGEPIQDSYLKLVLNATRDEQGNNCQR